MPSRIDGLNAIAKDYPFIACDVWGVVHNGVEIYGRAAHALQSFRAKGGRVVLITNSPRPGEGVAAQLRQLGLPADAWDAIATSGDVTKKLISQAKGPIFHLGPERDRPLFDGLDVDLSKADDANAIACTGLFEDETETPDDYRPMLEQLVARDLPFICANPDIVVERGERLIWCAGALAQLYEEMGGKTLLAGKPHNPIYEMALEKLGTVSNDRVEKKSVLAIGDGMPTDVKGAQDNGLDLLFVAGGIHSAEYGGPTVPDVAALDAFLKEHKAAPVAWLPHLVW